MFEKQWTKYAFATGRTLSLRDSESDNAEGKNWSASESYGTPGTANDYALSVATTTKTPTVRVFPNPCAEYVIVATEGDFTYEIVSKNGSAVTSGKGCDTQTISLQNIADDIYLIVITQNSVKNISEILKSSR